MLNVLAEVNATYSAFEPEIVTFDVTEALPREMSNGEPLTIVARLFIPQDHDPDRATLVACMHGGCYDWRYFHIPVAGASDYSMASHLAGMGHIVLVPDQIGIGESSTTALPRKITRHVAAAANDAMYKQAVARLIDGRLSPRLKPCPSPRKIGIGHSLGAMLLVTQQAAYRTYDLVAPLGYTGLGADMKSDGNGDGALTILDESAPAYIKADLALLGPTFHWPGLTPEVHDADAAITDVYLTAMAIEARSSHDISESFEIDVPVFLALGERDVSPDPYRESTRFAASPDITMLWLKETGHCHNFAPARHLLWTRLGRWIGSFFPAA